LYTLLFLLISICYADAQSDTIVNQSDQTFNAKKKNFVLAGGITTYAGLSSGLYFAWYKKHPQSAFHFFDDTKEWRGIDKAGHIFSGYSQTDFIYHGLKWAGYDADKSRLYACLSSLTFQTTIEIMDGFSTAWGFSVPDMVSNVVGVTGFAVQDRYWGEQKIRIKMSSWPKSYPNAFAISESSMTLSDQSLEDRAADLYGSGFFEKFLKDYNAQTFWFSFNLSSLAQAEKIPSWLNVAIGYSAENMYGGFRNRWTSGEEIYFTDDQSKRYSQFILALDYDLSKIKTESPFLKALLGASNALKFPAPAIEVNTLGEVHFHLIFKN